MLVVPITSKSVLRGIAWDMELVSRNFISHSNLSILKSLKMKEKHSPVKDNCTSGQERKKKSLLRVFYDFAPTCPELAEGLKINVNATIMILRSR